MRRDFTQATFNEKNSNLFFMQILVVAVVIGFIAESWLIFGAVLIGLIWSLQFREVAQIVCVVFALAWGGVGFAIGKANESKEATIVLAIIGFLIGLGVNLSGLQWARDVAGIPDEENEGQGYDDEKN